MISNVQAMRALAASLVLFVHLDMSSLGITPFGWGGVDIFFVISGFIMVHATRPRPPSGGAFMAQRAARIVPLYWVATIAFFFVTLPHAYDWSGLLESLAFVPYQRGSVEPILFVGWTLNYEMFFYLLFALGLCVRPYALGCALVIGALTGIVAAGSIWPAHGAGHIALWEQFYTSPKMLEFAMGMAIGLLETKLPTAPPGRYARPLLAVTAVLSVATVVLSRFVTPQAPQVLVCGLPSALLLLCALCAERWQWRIGNKIVLRLGDASYALYLLHPFVTTAQLYLIHRLHPHPLEASALAMFCLALIFAVALAAHYWIELPLNTAARALLLKRKPRPAVA